MTKARQKPQLVTRRELATALGVSTRTLSAWEADGLLKPAQRGRGGAASRFDLGAAVKAHAERMGPGVGKLDAVQARARRDLATARLMELREAREQGKLVPADEVERAWTAEVMAVRSFLLSLPQTHADRIHRAAVLDGLAGVERVLLAAVHGALSELAAGEHLKD